MILWNRLFVSTMLASAALGVAIRLSPAARAAETSTGASTQAADQAPQLYQSDGAELQHERERYKGSDATMRAAVARLLHKADGELTDGPWSVTAKKHPLPGIDPHDYVSLGPYDWPNPQTADGLPYIRKDGVRNPEINDYDVVPLSEMSKHVYTLAMAGYFSGDARYSARAARLLRVFFLNPATAMRPNFTHAQMIKGLDEGRHAGMIECRRLSDVVDAVQLLKQSPSAWGADDDAQIHRWFSDFADWMQNSKMGRDESNAPNNHGTWYDVQLVSFRLFVGQPDQARAVLEAAKTKRIASELEPDGSAPKELVRIKSLSYSTFNLLAMSNLAELGQRVGVDLWHYQTPDGRCIRRSIDFLLPYAAGTQKWPHEQIVPYDASAMLIPLRAAAAAYDEPGYLQDISLLHISRQPDLDEPAPGSQF